MSPLLRRAVAAAAAAIAALVLSATPAHAGPDGHGRLNEADMTLLIRLHRAGLWEIPAARLAAQRATNPKVREVAQQLAAEHARLDEQVTTAAGQLGATLPSAPATPQQAMLDQLRAAAGDRFDRLFVTSLRDAYGFLYPIVGEVRSATRNPVIRRLADQANVAVLGYLQALEGTGLVTYAELGPAAIPPAQDLSAMGMARADAGIAPPISPAVLGLLAFAAAAIAVITAMRIRRARRVMGDPRTAARRA